MTLSRSPSSEAQDGAKVVAWTSTASHEHGGEIFNRFILREGNNYTKENGGF